MRGGYVRLACDGALHILRVADGDQVKRFDFGRDLTAPAAGDAARDAVMLLTDDGYAVVLEASRPSP